MYIYQILRFKYIYIYNITNIYIFKYQDRFKDLSNKTNYIL